MVVVLCDDNEFYDNTPRPEAHPSLPSELRYDFSEKIDQMFELETSVMAVAENSNELYKLTNALYEWHITQNHFPDTRGQHRHGGRVTLFPVPPLLSNEIPAATPTVNGRRTSFDQNAYNRMYNHSRKMSDAIYNWYHSQNHILDTRDDDWYAGRTVLLATLSSCSSHSYEIPADTPTAGGCTSLDSNAFSRMLWIQPESNEQFTYAPYTTIPEPTRTQVHVENQPEPKHVPGPEARPCSYQDFLDALFVLETRFTTLYEQDKLGHEMTKAMYEWHLSKNHLTEKGHVIFSKL